MRKVSLIFGTRPEAIKPCLLVLALRKISEFEPHICVIGKHHQTLDQVLEWEGIEAAKIKDIKPMKFFQLRMIYSQKGMRHC